jgi:hypothetical protein
MTTRNNGELRRFITMHSVSGLVVYLSIGTAFHVVAANPSAQLGAEPREVVQLRWTLRVYALVSSRTSGLRLNI